MWAKCPAGKRGGGRGMRHGTYGTALVQHRCIADGSRQNCVPMKGHCEHLVVAVVLVVVVLVALLVVVVCVLLLLLLLSYSKAFLLIKTP